MANNNSTLPAQTLAEIAEKSRLRITDEFPAPENRRFDYRDARQFQRFNRQGEK